MGGLLSIFSSKKSEKVEEVQRDQTVETKPPPVVPAAPVDQEDLVVDLKSRAILSRDAWDEVIESAEEEPADITVQIIHLQLKVTSSDEKDAFMCVRNGGHVCLDGKPNARNTIFKVSKVYPPPIDKYQFLCTGGQGRDFVLYPEGNTLKSKKFDAEKDYVCKDTAEQTLLNVEIQNEDSFSITIESREGPFSGTDSQPIKFTPYVVGK